MTTSSRGNYGEEKCKQNINFTRKKTDIKKKLSIVVKQIKSIFSVSTPNVTANT